MLKNDITINIALRNEKFEYRDITNLLLVSSISPSYPVWVEDKETGNIYKVLTIDTYLAKYIESETFIIECPIVTARYIDTLGTIDELIITADGEIKVDLIHSGELMTEQQLLDEYTKLRQESLNFQNNPS